MRLNESWKKCSPLPINVFGCTGWVKANYIAVDDHSCWLAQDAPIEYADVVYGHLGLVAPARVQRSLGLPSQLTKLNTKNESNKRLVYSKGMNHIMCLRCISHWEGSFVRYKAMRALLTRRLENRAKETNGSITRKLTEASTLLRGKATFIFVLMIRSDGSEFNRST